VKIDDWFKKRKDELDGIIKGRNYIKAVSVFNNKGLRVILAIPTLK